MKIYKKYFSVGIFILIIIAIGLILPFAKKVAKISKDWETHALPKNEQTLSPKVTMSERNTVGFGACWDMRAEIDTLFEKARVCQEDSDCIVENKWMFCPFGCFQIHNTSYNIDEIMKKVIEFQDEKCFLCEYSCMTPPDQSDLKCLENQCVDIRYKKR